MDLIVLKYKENIPVLFLNVLLHLNPFKIIANIEKFYDPYVIYGWQWSPLDPRKLEKIIKIIHFFNTFLL